MESAKSDARQVQMHWVASKKNHHELIMVVIASVLGFGVVIALITLAELAQISPR